MKKREWMIPVISVSLVILVVLANVFGVFSGELSFRLTITTSIYATLISILLALLALAVTAYIFLATSLKDRRESYEQETIEQMLSVQTKNLLFLTALGIVMLVLCFLIDNADSNIRFVNWLPSFTIAVSSAVSLLLLIYICDIINYESRLSAFAKKARRALFHKKSNKIPLDTSIFKLIGDLEMLITQLAHNHKDDFHATDLSDTLKSIGLSQTSIDTYRNLISYRNFLWMESQKKDAKIEIEEGEQQNVLHAVRQLENALKVQCLRGERLKHLNFIHPFLAQSRMRFCLDTTVFTESAFEKVDFSHANLQSADFSQSRLNEVNLEKANCTDACFSEAVFRSIRVDTKTVFEKAVFRNTDFGRQKFCADEEGVFRFQNASFVRANLIECVFCACDFRYANFNYALMASIKLNSVCLSYADLSDAILTDAVIQFQREKAGCFPVEKYWKDSQLEQGRPSFNYTNFYKDQQLGSAFFVNLERGTLSQARLSAYNFAGSRMADANFSDARVETCIFDRCYGQRATFQEASIQSCRFQYAMFDTADLSYAQLSDCDFSNVNLRDSLMVKAKSERSSFQKANFTNAQLRGCRFVSCDLTDARFVDADLTGASFYDCILTGALFDGTDQDSFDVDKCTGYTRPQAGLPETGGSTMGENNTALSIEEAIQGRKSTRSFERSRAIAKDLLDRLLSAALRAPSPKNRQPWHFTVVQEKDEQDALAQILEQKLQELRAIRSEAGKVFDDLDFARESARVLREASALIFVSYIRDEKMNMGMLIAGVLTRGLFEAADLQSIGAAIENMLLTAEAHGIASLWMCDVLYAYQEYMEYLKLEHPLVACIALGYQTKHHTPRASLEEKVQYWKQ